MEDKDIRKYKDDEFKINLFYDEKGKTLNDIIEDAFQNFYQYMKSES